MEGHGRTIRGQLADDLRGIGVQSVFSVHHHGIEAQFAAAHANQLMHGLPVKIGVQPVAVGNSSRCRDCCRVNSRLALMTRSKTLSAKGRRGSEGGVYRPPSPAGLEILARSDPGPGISCP